MELAKLEQQLAQLPLFQYAFLPVQELPFSERVQQVCQQECPMYGKSWSCPPAVGSVAQCHERCLGYDGALLLVTVQEVADNADLQQTLATKPFHNQVMRQAEQLLQQQNQQTLCLSGDACSRCAVCAYPDHPCREPAQMSPCMEGYGIVVSALAERLGVPFPPEPGLVYWYALILFREKA